MNYSDYWLIPYIPTGLTPPPWETPPSDERSEDAADDSTCCTRIVIERAEVPNE